MNPYVKDARSANQHIAVTAHDLGLSPMTVYFWWAGDTIPLLHNLIAFADYYEVSLDYLCGRTSVKHILTEAMEKRIQRKVHV